MRIQAATTAMAGAILAENFVIRSGTVPDDGTIRLYYTKEYEGETGYYILLNLPREDKCEGSVTK